MRKWFIALTAGINLMLAGHAEAQIFTTLHSFGNLVSGTNSDGANPYAGLILSSNNTLYGTALEGGSNGDGTVFALNTNGTGFTALHTFYGGSNDGANPEADLMLSGNTLYGTTYGGGTNGTVFALNTNGTTGFVILYTFSATVRGTNSDGTNPQAGLVLLGNTLYGTANYGGLNDKGTVFALNTNGTDFTNLHTFTFPVFDPTTELYTNSDGVEPYADMILSGTTLYGTAFEGGTNGTGTVFALNINGTGFTVLHNFSAIAPVSGTNSDGAIPYSDLILSGNTLYGTAYQGGVHAGERYSHSILMARVLPSCTASALRFLEQTATEGIPSPV